MSKTKARQEVDALIERTRTLVEKKPALAERILRHWVQQTQTASSTSTFSRPQPKTQKIRKAA